MDTKKIIKEFLLSEITHDLEAIDDHQQLIDNGIIDSIQIVKVIIYLENTFEITFSEDDIFPENFETIDAMTNIVNNKLLKKEDL